MSTVTGVIIWHDDTKVRVCVPVPVAEWPEPAPPGETPLVLSGNHLHTGTGGNETEELVPTVGFPKCK